MRGHEDPRGGWGRARACPVLFAASQPARRGNLLRSGQPGHRRGRRLPARRAGRHRRDRGPGRDPPRRPDGGRAGAAALARHRRRVHQARPADLRSHAAGGADRVVESVLEGVLPAPQHPDGRGGRVPDRRGGAQGHQAVRLSGRAQGGRPRRRQGRAHHRDRRGRGAGAPALLPGAGLRRGGRSHHRRGVPAGAGVLVPRPVRRRGGRAPADGARLQEGLRRRPRPEHRRHGSPLAGGRPERRDGFAGPEGHPLADAARPAGRGTLVPRRALRRADAHGVGPEGPRVQRAFRRPGNGSHPSARDVRHGRRPAWPPRRAASRASCRSR